MQPTTRFGANAIALSEQANIKMEAARQAFLALRKTFGHWVMIGDGIVALRARADELGGRKTFHRLLEQQGFGTFIKAKAVLSRLEKIMARLPEVEKWHRGLSEKQQIDWSSPSAVLKHCPIFITDGTSKPRPQPAVAKPQNLAKVMEQQEQRIEELEQELDTARAPLTVEQHFKAAFALLKDEPEPVVMKHIAVLKNLLDDWRKRSFKRSQKPKPSKGTAKTLDEAAATGKPFVLKLRRPE
jgi:hypothetical protein